MSEWSTWRRFFRLPGADVRRTVNEELEFHLDMRTRDLTAEGLAPDAARRQAECEFGELRPVRDACVTIEARRQRRLRLGEIVAGVVQDFRFAVRTLRGNAGFTAAALVCVALGVGATTTIFSAVHATLIRPLPFPRADELVVVYSRIIARDERGINISRPDFLSWRDENTSFADFGMWTWRNLSFTGDVEAERVEGAAISTNIFQILGVRPLLGRPFSADEETPGKNLVVLLSHRLWQRRFAGARDIVGRTVMIDARPHTVVGVMPPGFAFPERGQAWVPLVVDLSRESHGNRYFAAALGRLKPGVTVAQAQRDLSAISARLAETFPQECKGWDAQAISIRDDLVGDLRRPLVVFSGSVIFVLLIACVNVANLILARGAARQREIAVRTALGAGRGRLVRQLLTESILLAAAGGVLGAALSVYGVDLLRLTFPQEVPFYITLGVDAPTLAFATVASLATGMIFGVVPAVRATRASVDAVLRDSGRGATGGASRSRLRGALVITELALSVVLMIGAGLLIKSYRTLEGTHLGFRENDILTFGVTLPPAAFPEPGRRTVFFERLLDRLAALPGVASAGSAQGVPFSGWDVQAGMMVEGAPPPRPGEDFESHYQWMSPNYLSTIDVPVVRGRGLLPTDRDSVAVVGVINETFAKRAFPKQNPIGKRVRIGGPESTDPWVTIVGVVRDFRQYRLPQPMGPALYMPYASSPASTQTVVVRVKGGSPAAIVPTVRSILRELDPNVPMYRVQTMDEYLARSLWRQRLQGQVLGLFAALAIVLAVVGIYGVISYGVVQRSREFGVRVALGAQPRDVVALVLAEGGKLALLGVGLGVLGALGLARLLEKLLYDVKPTDPATFTLVAGGLGVVALVASYIPARRATRVDPVVAMRPE